MDASETSDVQSWLDALDNGTLDPNLMDITADNKYARAWSREHNGDYYVYYEEGVGRSTAMRMMVGSVAVRDVEGLSQEDAKDKLLDSAITPIVEREKVAVRTHLRLLMGLNPLNLHPSKPKTLELAGFETRFMAQMSQLSRLDRETIDGLGLQHFGSLPFRSKADKHIYLVSKIDLDKDWPALRYYYPKPKWEYRLLRQDEVGSMEGFKDNEYKASLIRSNGWIPIRGEEITRISTKLASKRTNNSL